MAFFRIGDVKFKVTLTPGNASLCGMLIAAATHDSAYVLIDLQEKQIPFSYSKSEEAAAVTAFKKPGALIRLLAIKNGSVIAENESVPAVTTTGCFPWFRAKTQEPEKPLDTKYIFNNITPTRVVSGGTNAREMLEGLCAEKGSQLKRATSLSSTSTSVSVSP